MSFWNAFVWLCQLCGFSKNKPVRRNIAIAERAIAAEVLGLEPRMMLSATTQPPVGTSGAVSTAINTPYTFHTADFGFTDPKNSPANTLAAVEITTLPTLGTLKDNGVAVKAQQFVSVSDITAGKLVFTPGTNVTGLAYSTFTFQVQSSGLTTNGGVNVDPTPKTMTINIPSTVTISNVETTPGTFSVGASPVLVTALATISESASTAFIQAVTVKIAANYNASEDVLTFNNSQTPHITGFWNAGSGQMVLEGTATVAEYQTALRSVYYQDTNVNSPNAFPRSISIQATDSDGLSLVSTRAFNIVDNVGGLTTTPLSYTAGKTPSGYTTIAIASALTLTPTATGNVNGASVKVGANYVNGEDLLIYPTQIGNITAAFSASTGTLVFTGSDTVAHYQAALRSVLYADTSVTPTISVRRFDFWTGTATAPSAQFPQTGQGESYVSVSAHSATISSIETTIASFVQSTAPLQITNTAALTDSNSAWTTAMSATVQISSNYVSTEDVLSFNNSATPNITGVWNSTTGTLTLTGNDTLAHYQTALRSVYYQNTNFNSPNSLIRAISFSVYDGSAVGPTATRYINIDDNVQTLESTTYVYSTGNTPAGPTTAHVTNTLTIAPAAGGYLYGASLQISANYVQGEDILAYPTQIGSITGTFNPSTGTLTLAGKDTVANYQAALRSITYSDISATPTNGIRRFDIWTGTASAPSTRFPATGEGERYFSIQLHSAIISNVESATASFVQDSAPLQITATATVSDSNTSITSATSAVVSISANFVSTEDVLSFNNTLTPKITGVWNSTNGTLTLTGADTLADYQTALRSVYYQNTNFNSPSSLVRRISFSVFDGTVVGPQANRYINIDDNVQNVESTTFAYTTGNTPNGPTSVNVTSTLTIATPVGGFLYGASMQISANYAQGEDVLSYPTQIGSITGTFNASTGTLTLAGKDTVANYQAALRSITYSDISASPTNGIRRFDIWTGTATSPSTRFPATGQGERYFSIQLHSAIVSNVETTTASFVQDSNPLQVTATATVSDTNANITTVTSAVVSISANFVSTEDVLSYNNSQTPNITGVWNATNGTLTLTGSDTLANYQTALRSIYYQNTNFNSPNSLIRRVSFSLFDGSVIGATANRYINIDDNVQTLESKTYVYNVGSPATAITNTLTIPTPAGGNLYGASVKISANYVQGEDILAYPTQIGNITGTFYAATGTLVLTGQDTSANYQTALRSITYQDNSATPTLMVRAFDFWTGTASAPSPRFPATGQGERYFNVDQVPTVATAASATPSPVTGTTTQLSVMGAYGKGQGYLTYTWTVTSLPNGATAPTFSINGNNAASGTVATFSMAGNYTFKVTISNPAGASVTSTVNVTVNQTLTSIKVTPVNPTIDEGQSKTFTATGYDQFTNVMTVQPTFAWSNTGAGSINPVSGLYAAGAVPGSAVVTATSNSVTGTSNVTVVAPLTIATAAAANPTTVTGTTTNLSVLGADVSGESTLTYTWAATTIPVGASTPTFSVNGTNAAKATVATFYKIGTYIFTVTLTDQQNYTLTSSVTVLVTQSTTTINVTPATKTMDATQSAQFSAVALDQFGVNMAVQPTFTWTVPAADGTITTGGKFTASASILSTTAVAVTATANSISGIANVTVKPLPTIAVNAYPTANNPVVVGTSTGLNVLGADVDGESTLTYTWVTTGTPPAAVTFDVTNGTNAAKSINVTFIAAGSYSFQVTITDQQGGTVISSVFVDVAQVSTSFKITPTSAGPLDGVRTQQFTGTELDQFGNAIPSFDYSIVWWVATAGAGTIDTTGLFTAATNFTGTATIKAICTDSTTQDQFTKSATVTVIPLPTITTPASANPSPVTGVSAVLSVAANDTYSSFYNSNLKYTWAIQPLPATQPPGGVVTYSAANGTTSGNTVVATFNESGTYNLQVSVADPLGGTVTSLLTVVVNQTLTTITVSPPSATLYNGQTQQFTAIGKDQFGIPMSPQPTITWTATGTGAGTISTGGLFTASNTGGPATVTATNGSVNGTASVSVGIQPPPTIGTAASATPSPVVGTTTNLSVLATDVLGVNNLEPTLTYTWAATIIPPGAPTPTFSVNGTNAAKNTVATFGALGTYQFTVTVKDTQNQTVTSSVSVTVNQGLASIKVTPANQTLLESHNVQYTATGYDQFNGVMVSQPTFTWSSSGSGSINSSTGLYATPATPGTATITASAPGPFSTVTGSTTANVTATGSTPVITAVASAAPTTVTGTTSTLSVTASDTLNGASALSYSWQATITPGGPLPSFSVNNSNAANTTVVTFAQAGGYTFQVTVTDMTTGQTATSQVNVQVNQTFTSIGMNPGPSPAPKTSPLGTIQFAATAFDQFLLPMAVQPSFTWSVASGVGSINSSGLYTAPNSTGVAGIKVTSGSVSNQETIFVIVAPTVATPPAITPNPVTGTTGTLSVLGASTGYPESQLTYTWSTLSSPIGAPAPTFSVNGTNAAKNAIVTFGLAGNYQLQVTITDPLGGFVNTTLNVTVSQTVTTINVSAPKSAVDVGQTDQLTATAYDQFGTVLAVQPTFSWSGGGSGGGTVNSSTGLYTAANPAGVNSVTASFNSVSSAPYTIMDYALPVVATAATATPSTVSGTTTALSVSGTDGAGVNSGLIYTWAATTKPIGSNPTFSANGTNAAQNSTVTFNKAGNYTFTVTITDIRGGTTTTSVNVVVNQTVTSITASGLKSSVDVGQTDQFSASAKDQFGNAMAVQPTFTWNATGTSGGTVDSSGLYTAGASAGTDGVVASANSINSNSASVTVYALPTVGTAAAATPNPSTGTTSVLSVSGVDGAGNNASLTYTWSVPGGVTLSANGTNAAQSTTATFTATGVFPFTVTITDPRGGTTTSNVSVTVNQALTSIIVLPSIKTVAENGTVQFTATGYDQFGTALSVQPTFAWTNNGGGAINSSGFYTAPNFQESELVFASASGHNQSATINVQRPPTVTTPAAATPNPVTGLTTALSVAGSDGGGNNASLTYNWVATTIPPLVSAPTFSVNGTNAAKNTTATFSAAGVYIFTVTITDTLGQTVTSQVTVTVNQTLTTIKVAPVNPTIDVNQTDQFSATGYDQFGNAMAIQPAITWATTGSSTINSSGLFTAQATSGNAQVTATNTATGVNGSQIVTILPLPTVATTATATFATATTATLAVLGGDAVPPGESSLIYTWTATTKPVGATPVFSANGTNAAKNSTVTFNAAGDYVFTVTIADPQNGTITSATATYTVTQAITTITVTGPHAVIDVNQNEAFTATGYDQFGKILSVQPTFSWSNTGDGTMAGNLFTAGSVSGVATVMAQASSVTGTFNVTINPLPTVSTVATATPSTVTGVSTALSVLGNDVSGEASLTYTWQITSPPTIPAPTFSVNGTNAAKNTTVTFGAAGTYSFAVIITDAQGGTNASNVTVTVNQTLTSITVTPANVYAAENSTDQVTAIGYDQFGAAMSSQPTFSWAFSGVGSVDSNGLYSSPNASGTATIYGYVGGIQGQTTITVLAPPTVATTATATPPTVGGTTTTLSVLGADSSVSESNLTYTWAATTSPAGSNPVFSANGTNAAKNSTVTFNAAGIYVFKVTITDPAGQQVTSSISVTVNQTTTSIALTPVSQNLDQSQTEQFTANALDQFGIAMAVQPAISWGVTSGVGSISGSGLYTAPSSSYGTATITATAGSVSQSATINVYQPPVIQTRANANGDQTHGTSSGDPTQITGTSVLLNVVGAVVAGEPPLTYNWIATSYPAGAPTFGTNNSTSANTTTATFSATGLYVFTVFITDAQGTTVSSTVYVNVS